MIFFSLHPREKGQQTMRPFFILWTGQALSLLGTQAVQFALIWWLTVETGSATVLATASLFGLAPQIVAGPFIGIVPGLHIYTFSASL